MSKLVLLKKETNESRFVKLEDNNEGLKDRYFEFENKIFNSEVYSKIKENELSICIKKIFDLNKNIFIKFLNSIYDDFLGTNSMVEIIEVNDSNTSKLKSPNTLFKAKVDDEYRSYEYNIEIQCSEVENISILISKTEIYNNKNNIVNFNKKKEEYKSILDNKKIDNQDVCLIMLNSNINVPDNYIIQDKFNDSKQDLKIIKLWKYDIKEIFRKELYLLAPLKIIDLKNMIRSVQNINNSNKIIENEIKRFYMIIDKLLDILIDNGTINSNDVKMINSIIHEFLNLIY